MEAYLGYVVRLDFAMTHHRLYRNEVRTVLGMHLLWHDALVMKVAQATAVQTASSNAPTPSWTEAVIRMHEALVISAASLRNR